MLDVARGFFEVDGYRCLPSLAQPTRFVVYLGDSGSHGYLEVDFVSDGALSPDAEPLLVRERIRQAIRDPERVVHYPPGEGPVIRKEQADG